jgi:hypothetical protein
MVWIAAGSFIAGVAVIAMVGWPPLRRIPGLVKTLRQIRRLPEHTGRLIERKHQ